MTYLIEANGRVHGPAPAGYQTQAFIRTPGDLPEPVEPSPERINPITDRWVKPYGGLWTSTYDEAIGSDWVRWCLGEGYVIWPGQAVRIFKLQLGDHNVYRIRSYGCLEALVERYPDGDEHCPYPDWRRIAEDYDGVHLTSEGQIATHLSHPLNLYGWDCESTLWFRWKFTEVEDLGLVTIREA